MILIFGVQVGQGGKLVEADEPVHTQAQENDNQNTGEYLVQHVTVFDSQTGSPRWMRSMSIWSAPMGQADGKHTASLKSRPPFPLCCPA